MWRQAQLQIATLVLGHEPTVPIRGGQLALGTWQGVFLWEHRHGAMQRELVVTLYGEAG